MYEIEINRNSHLIDPVFHIWGWEIPVYLFLGGVAAGIMIFSALLHRQLKPEQQSRSALLLPWAVPVLLGVGMLALFLDLEHRWYAFRFYLTFEVTSPMSWGSWILLAVVPASIGLGLLGLSEDDVRRLTRRGPLAWFAGLIMATHRAALRHRRALGTANIVLGIALGVYTGVLLSTLAARPIWNSAVLGPLFLVSGISTGAALMMLLPLAHAEHSRLRRWDMLAIAAELTLIVLFLITLSNGGDSGRGAAKLLLGGTFTAPFWGLVVLAGLLVPFVLEALEGVRKLPPTRIAATLLLVGGLALRWIIVLAGQA